MNLEKRKYLLGVIIVIIMGTIEDVLKGVKALATGNELTNARIGSLEGTLTAKIGSLESTLSAKIDGLSKQIEATNKRIDDLRDGINMVQRMTKMEQEIKVLKEKR